MENLKFILVSIIIITVLGFMGYWAFFTIKPANVLKDEQKQQQLEDRNEELAKEVTDLKNQIAILRSSQPKPTTIEEPDPAPIITPTKPIVTPTKPTTTSKYQNLINELQKLVDDNIFMKEKSAGTRVGTLQNFLNIYNKTSKRVDNDYGATTKADVIKFQKAEGITADGETGPATYRKMIEWLKAND